MKTNMALRLSEDAACNRIDAAGTCRRFAVILELLVAGEITLTTVRLLGRHLTPENHQAVLARAARRRRQQLDLLVAELAPRPDIPSSASTPEPATVAVPSPAAFVPVHRPIVQPTAPERYRVQFTIDQETHDDLRCLQALLRREIPDGDPAAIFKRAGRLLREKVENKLGVTKKPRRSAVTRPGTDKPRSREIPRAVKRVVWRHDAGQCTLEFHHVQAHVLGGPATTDNISLRCWRHNQYEGELIFGPRPSRIRGENDGSWLMSEPG